MAEDHAECLDEIISYVESPGSERAPQARLRRERRDSKYSPAGSDGIQYSAMLIARQKGDIGKRLRFAAQVFILASVIFCLALAFAPASQFVAAEATQVVPPQPPPPPGKLPAPFSTEFPVALPLESPDGQDDGGQYSGAVVQPQLELTRTVQPVMIGATIPNALVVLIGIAVVEKVRVRKRLMRMKVSAEPANGPAV